MSHFPKAGAGAPRHHDSGAASLAASRLALLLAGVLWSLGGIFIKTFFAGLPAVAPLTVGGVTLYLVSLTLFALAPTPLLAGAALLSTGLGGSAFSIMQATLIYLSAAAEMRGRMLGVLATCIGIGPFGFLHIGLLAEAIGAKYAIVVVGIEGLLVVFFTRRIWRALYEEEVGQG